MPNQTHSIETLTTSTFAPATHNGVWLTLFWAPFSEPAQRMSAEWPQVREMMDEWTGQYVSSGAVAPGRREKLKKEGLAGGRRRPEVRLGVVDIEQEAALGQDLKVNGVPLVVLWAAGVPLGELVGRIGAREVADWAIGYLMDDQFSV